MKAKIILAAALALVMMMSVMPTAMGASADPSPYIPADHADMIAGGGNVKGATDVGDIKYME